MDKSEGITKIEIVKKDGKFHVNVVKEECGEGEDITDEVLKRISKSLNIKTLKKTLKNHNSKGIFSLFGDTGLFEKSLIEKNACRQITS